MKTDMSKLTPEAVQQILERTLQYRDGLLRAGVPGYEVTSLTAAFQASLMLPTLMDGREPWDR